MSTWKLTALALVLGMAFCGAANAATLTLSLELVNYGTGAALTPAEIAALVPGNTFGVAVYGQVAGVPNGYGIAGASWTIYTPGTSGVIAPGPLVLGKIPNTFGPTIDYNIKIGPANQDFADAGLDPDGDLDSVGSSVAGFNGNLDIGVVKTLLQTQKWQVLTPGSLSPLAIFVDPRAEYIDENAGDFTTTFDSVVGMGIGGSNEPPTMKSVSKSQITESDWDIHGQLVYNDDAHSIDISAEGEDSDGDAVSFRWTMTKPGGGSVTLAETTGMLHMTIGDIKSLVLPVWGVDTNMWSLSVEAYDGTAYSAPTIIPTFVPEPATMGLLAFGVVGLLKRRRRA